MSTTNQADNIHKLPSFIGWQEKTQQLAMPYGRKLTATLEVVRHPPAAPFDEPDGTVDVDESSQFGSDEGAHTLDMAHSHPLAALRARQLPI